MKAKDAVVLEPAETLVGRFQKERTDAISEMFDNKDDYGIYPTTKFFARLDKCVREIAEISFKAGQDSVPEPWDREQSVFEDGKKAGIREVVEWIEMVPPVDKLPEGNMKHYAISLEQWQAKLKEWGISNGNSNKNKD